MRNTALFVLLLAFISCNQAVVDDSAPSSKDDAPTARGGDNSKTARGTSIVDYPLTNANSLTTVQLESLANTPGITVDNGSNCTNDPVKGKWVSVVQDVEGHVMSVREMLGLDQQTYSKQYSYAFDLTNITYNEWSAFPMGIHKNGENIYCDLEVYFEPTNNSGASFTISFRLISFLNAPDSSARAVCESFDDVDKHGEMNCKSFQISEINGNGEYENLQINLPASW